MILAVDHCQITVPREREAEAREFYLGVLGLKEVEKPDNRKGKGGFWTQLGEFQVHISLEDGVDRAKTRAHIAYRVDNLDSWRLKLKERGFNVVDSLPFPQARAFEFRDPFGNRLEMIEYSAGTERV